MGTEFVPQGKCTNVWLNRSLRVYFWGNLVHTNPNVPSKLFWAKIWCILLEEQSQCPWISFTIPTELKSSSPLQPVIAHKLEQYSWSAFLVFLVFSWFFLPCFCTSTTICTSQYCLVISPTWDFHVTNEKKSIKFNGFGGNIINISS